MQQIKSFEPGTSDEVINEWLEENPQMNVLQVAKDHGYTYLLCEYAKHTLKDLL